VLKNKLFIEYKKYVVVVEIINNGDKKEYRSIHKYYIIDKKYNIGKSLLINAYNVQVAGLLIE
tara:strand:- start:121 stop:309 length:189 start_codon:yes stop_codon:yes gene_type:complete